MLTPPPLAWLPDVADSLGRALGCSVSYQVQTSVMPLMYKVVLRFSSPQDPKFTGQIWNLVQMYGARNDAIVTAKDFTPQEMVLMVGVKRRLGPARRDAP